MTNELDLNTIATEINGEHAACFEAARATLAHAIRAGELLQQAKELLKHGEWAPWLAENCEFSARTARNYMRLAEHKNELAKRQDNAILTVSGALALLAEPKQELNPADKLVEYLYEMDMKEFSNLVKGLPKANSLSDYAIASVLPDDLTVLWFHTVTKCIEEVRDTKLALA